MKMQKFWFFSVLVMLAALPLAGCSGKDGAAGAPGSNATNVVKVSTLTTDQWAELAPKGEVTSVTINSPPVVKFKVTDANGNPVVGLADNTTKSSTAALTSYSNVALSIAKLVPGTNGSPSKWVSYIVTNIPTVATPNPTTGTRPTTDNTGTLVDHGDGSYTYTFYRDITKVKDVVAAYTDSGSNRKADLGDLTYDPSLTHRVVVQISGNARGTGSNTPDGVTVATGVPMVDPVNIIYDFIPATGKAVAANNAQREVVTTANCNECHGKLNGLGFHGGARNDARFCVVCHTDQRKYGRDAVVSTNGSFPALTFTVNATTNALSATPNTYVADGETAGDFPVMIHKIHMGTNLKKTNYNYANIFFDKMGYSMLGGGIENCRKCHRGDSDAQKAAAPQANNWKDVPSRLACGSCHDGINWTTGQGTAIGARGVTAGGHVGGSATSDTACVICHKAADIELYHTSENATANNPSVPTGAANFTYEIASVTVNSSNQPVVKWRIKKDGVAVTSWNNTGNVLTGFTGGPSFLVAYAVPQDGQTASTTLVDFNNNGRNSAATTTASQPGSVTLANIANGTQGTLGTADADGYFTSTLTSAAATFPAGAKLRTVALQGYFTQVSPAVARHTLSAVKAVSGEARRQVIDNTKCGACHEWFEGHGGNRNIGLGNLTTDMNVCVLCHNPNITSSGRTTTNATMATIRTANNTVMTEAEKALLQARGYGLNDGDQLSWPDDTNNLKDMIHAFHAGKDRTNPFEIVRNRGSVVLYLNAGRVMSGSTALQIGIGYPNLLKNCKSCHIAGTYSAPPSTALVTTNFIDDATSPKTVASYTAARKTVPNTGYDLVTTPYTASCVSCHDSSAAQAHMTLNGGKIRQARANGMAAGESCATCHGAGKEFDPAKVHN